MSGCSPSAGSSITTTLVVPHLPGIKDSTIRTAGKGRGSLFVHIKTDEGIEAVNRAMSEIVRLTRDSMTESHEVLRIAHEVEESASGNARLVDQLSDASSALREQGDSLKRSVQHFVFG